MATGIAVNQTTVYYGPSSSTYPSEGSYVGPNETVTIVWQEGSWYYIEYYVGTTGTKKRMYIPTSALSNISGYVTARTLSGTAKTSSPATTYAGPGTGYAIAGSVGTESVTAYSEISGSYTFIEYNISGGLKKRAYINTNNLGSSGSLANLVGTVLADFNNSSYSSSGGNYYSPGQCTWYCWGRAKEKCGKSITFSGSSNAYQWYANANNCTKAGPSSTPVGNSIACFSDTGNGHVVFIEGVEGDTVYFTEANSWCPNGQLQAKSISEFRTLWGKTLHGYLLLQ